MDRDDELTSMAYERARSIHEALALLDEGGEEARPIAGGQSLVPLMNLGLAAPGFLIDVTTIPDLRRIEVTGQHLVIGAAITHHELTVDPMIGEHAPLLQMAARHIGSQRIRNRGTIGGSVVHGDPAAELPVCCSVLGAEYRVRSVRTDEWRRAEMFSKGLYQTDIASGELLTAIRVPRRSGFGWGFHEYARRAGDFALVSAAAGARVQDSTVATIFVAVTGADDRPTRLSSLEQQLTGIPVTEVESRMVGTAALVDPSDDPYSTGLTRARLIEALATRAVRDALHRAKDQAGGDA